MNPSLAERPRTHDQEGGWAVKVIVKLIILMVTLSLTWAPAPANAGRAKPLSTALVEGYRLLWGPVKRLGPATIPFPGPGSPGANLEYKQLQLEFTGPSDDERPVQSDILVGPEPHGRISASSLFEDGSESKVQGGQGREEEEGRRTSSRAKSPEPPAWQQFMDLNRNALEWLSGKPVVRWIGGSLIWDVLSRVWTHNQ